ncbi:hypothetical protein WN944_022324 [Citrus x changshan-huyou]|uniref:endo-polygalacturonase n=1 Tax=Citrus x changshan-huyou TaxID=2935761 RepID=A0AAP0QW12_9ROSI
MEADEMIEVKCLEHDEAWRLFLGKVRKATLRSHAGIPEVAEAVARECGGLPLALITIGRATASKDTSRMAKCSSDYGILRRDLIDYWVSEGFLDNFEDGYTVIGDLFRACLLEAEDVDSIKLHDVIRDMSLWITCKIEEENFLVRAGVGLTEIRKIEEWKGVKRISLMKTKIERQSGIPICPRLHTLLLTASEIEIITDGFFQFMPSLRVLSLNRNRSCKSPAVNVLHLAHMEHLQELKIDSSNLEELKIDYAEEELFFIISLLMCMATLGWSRSYPGAMPYNVMNFGAVGNGVTDDSQAFIKAWNAVCGDTSNNPTLQVPQGKTFLLQPTSFQGPCKSSNLQVQIEGNLIAPEGPSSWKGKDRRSWLYFANVNGFTVNGNGEIDGQGSQWWNLCSDYSEDCTKPTALVFEKCTSFQVSGLKHINSQKNHISLDNCQDATLSNLHISAPESSPNTDGIDISASQNIHILNSNIATGDDCVAINTGSSQINVTGLTCGPGHGISIGSLGKQGEAAAVEEVHVKNCTLNATQNGLRIKTWQGGSGYARKITFNDITLTDVDNPIIIDQFYCPHEQCSNETNAVKISDVSYTGIHGTSITQDAIALNCSRTVGCDNIVLEHIHIASSNSKEGTYSTCINAHGKCDDSVPSVGCLK